MGVAFTLPHNLDAFGVDFSAFSLSIFIGLLGVATLEGVFIFSMSHFTHGLIADEKQRKMAMWSWGIMTFVLISNAVVAELSHLEPAGILASGLLVYRGFILPATPIIALLLAGLLLSLHPKVVSLGKAFKHIADTAKKEQEAQLALLEAKNEIKLQDIQAKRQEHAADLEKRQIEAQSKIEKIRADALQSKQNQDFALNARAAVFAEKEAALKTELDSPEFKTDLQDTVKAEVKRIVRDQKKEALEALKK
ncbi:MAG: hypothetical protein KDE51_25810 [Anaerolineales bacterium]|nr:hypothetical protein [Anaerolineales bacterium]